jgi:hypothetical protein
MILRPRIIETETSISVPYLLTSWYRILFEKLIVTQIPISYQKKLKIKIYRTVTLPVVMYGCETWSLTLREEHRLRVFESRVLRRIFGP